MKNLFITLVISISFLAAHAQERSITRSARLDTNAIIYDEQGSALHYYQYNKLMNSGDYTLQYVGDRGTIKKISPQMKNMMSRMVRTQMAIKNSSIQEGKELDVSPLLEAVHKNDLDKKIIVMIFWDPDCPPCTESFEDISSFLKQINSPEDVTVLAITRTNDLLAANKLKQKPLLYARFLNSAGQVYRDYNLNSIPAYVVTDKEHIVRLAIAGQGGMTLSVFKDAIRTVLMQ